MKTLHAGLLVCVLLKLVEAVPLASFYTFGPSTGDTTLHRNDDSYSSLISLSTAFPYFGTNHRAVYVRAVQCGLYRKVLSAAWSYLAMRISIMIEIISNQIFNI